MPRRSNRSQSKHDAEVREIAEQFERQGFEVDADISGFPKPQTLGGKRPDVVARRGGQRKIVEVETTESAETARDLNQQKAFRAAAKRSKNTTFVRRVVKTKKP